MGGGGNPAEITTIEYVTISSSGGANDFGDLRIAYYTGTGLSNSTRGIIGGGQSAGSVYNTFTDFVVIATTGGSNFFGNLTARANMNQLSSAASSTRGLFAGGVNSNIIEFVTIATFGDAVDFGDLTIEKWMGDGGFSSPTRALFAGGYATPALRASIDFVTIATLGNAADFGDLTAARQQVAATSSSTRGVVAGGETPSATNIIDFTIGERKLYGKVHHLYRPVFVKYQSRLKQLKNSAAREPMYAFNFVADLFNEMVLDFERCAAKGQINRDDPFLSSLKPYKAYQDPTLAYEEYKDIFFSSMREKFTNGSIMIENFDHFMEVFMESAVRVATTEYRRPPCA